MTETTIPQWLADKLAFDGMFTSIPLLTQEQLRKWLLHGEHPGGFVEAILRNDLMGALDAADDENMAAIVTIVSWIKRKCPSECWIPAGKTVDIPRAPSAPSISGEMKPMLRTIKDIQRLLLYQFKGYLR